MFRFIVKRLLMLIPTLLGVLLIIFTINVLTPGDPAKLALGSQYTEEAYQRKREEMGLDRPFLTRYVLYVEGIVTRLDLGTSYETKRPVTDMVEGRLGTTLRIGLFSCLITITFGVSLGIVSAVRQYSPLDYAATTLSIIFSAAPAFWVSLLALLLFCLKLNWFPAGGLEGWRSYVLPTVCLALSPVSIVTRMTRTSMLDVVRQDYIRTARAKGVSERSVIFRHALRNAMIPVITVIGMQLIMVVGGSFIIESIFSIPGVGTLLLTSINNRDYPAIQGTILILSFFVCVINLLTDVAYAIFDPRIKSQYVSAGRARRKKEAKA